MSKVTEFYEAFSKDEAMRERADEAIVAFAKGEGYAFTVDELNDFINNKELSEGDLKAVAGGKLARLYP
ncbi:MAG: Nif11-like leader peptide family RiPP precursor [Spirochaetaceae bacterium]|jgi:predicted ribosomally synthesized peptide with nif11-like leader|nr:Nif11-like leader peptide family RiPP precursor [Spirochaetaceae bacterium]